VNEEAKKRLLRMLPHGVFVVTSGAGDGAHGFTVTWLTQVSFKPPLIVVAVRRDSLAYGSVTGSGAFCVNWISREQRPLAERFFQPPKASGSRFGDLPFHAGLATGAPVLDDALGFLECRVVHAFDHGDHSIVVGEAVEAGLQRDGDLLLLSDTPWKYGG
jgi:flavin reductase (DIM6/NTAB) family NADH-FMN oxidoreductase RutF